MEIVGKPVPRLESEEKVTGRAKYTNDFDAAGMLHARMLTSPYAHAKILSIDTTSVFQSPGVRAVVTGADFPVLTGPNIADQPILAVGKVRYFGEPVAVVVADSEYEAMRAVQKIRVEYEPLPVVNSPSQALQKNALLVHAKVEAYKRYTPVYPVAGTNIANHVKIRKGDLNIGWSESDVVVEAKYSFNNSDHAAMEPRSTRCEILPDGRIHLYSSTQDPFLIKKLFNRFFGIDEGKVAVHVPFVGGGFGGKGSIHLEYIVYVASLACGGRMVKLTNTREEDLVSSPCHIGLEAHVQFGATWEGKLRAAKITYLFDGGAYSDQGAIVVKAAAEDCTGPYAFEHVWCDSLEVYTNHPLATAFRGFGHPELHFCVERTMDLLAKKLNIDPLQLRLQNAIRPGDTTPTQTPLNTSNIGDLPECIRRLQNMMRWEEGQRIELGNGKVRAKGIACLWKTSSSPSDATSGAIITFNKDGSMNLGVGSVEMGQGNRTVLAQILAERLKMRVDQVHVKYGVNTQVNPEHWKTVASSSTMMVGRAVLNAAEDAIQQLKNTAAVAFGRSPDEFEVAGGRVFLIENPQVGIDFPDIVLGYAPPGGAAVSGQVIGLGRYVVQGVTPLDPETGKGNPGPQWTVAAQGVEVEFDPRDFTYKILKATTVLDAGKVINHGTAVGQMMGGMSMGLSFASRESFQYDSQGIVLNNQFRSYKLIHFGEHPLYEVDFVETPYLEGPYGARGIGEYGVIGMAPALANCLSVVAQVELFHLPLVPELIWRTKGGGR